MESDTSSNPSLTATQTSSPTLSPITSIQTGTPKPGQIDESQHQAAVSGPVEPADEPVVAAPAIFPSISAGGSLPSKEPSKNKTIIMQSSVSGGYVIGPIEPVEEPKNKTAVIAQPVIPLVPISNLCSGLPCSCTPGSQCPCTPGFPCAIENLNIVDPSQPQPSKPQGQGSLPQKLDVWAIQTVETHIKAANSQPTISATVKPITTTKTVKIHSSSVQFENGNTDEKPTTFQTTKQNAPSQTTKEKTTSRVATMKQAESTIDNKQTSDGATTSKITNSQNTDGYKTVKVQGPTIQLIQQQATAAINSNYQNNLSSPTTPTTPNPTFNAYQNKIQQSPTIPETTQNLSYNQYESTNISPQKPATLSTATTTYTPSTNETTKNDAGNEMSSPIQAPEMFNKEPPVTTTNTPETTTVYNPYQPVDIPTQGLPTTAPPPLPSLPLVYNNPFLLTNNSTPQPTPFNPYAPIETPTTPQPVNDVNGPTSYSSEYGKY